MQVKKFEAPNMKEALSLIKTQLGPEAIILAARASKKNYGVNIRGIEVTAAISEHTLKKKHFAENKLNKKNLKVYSSSSASAQKDFIDKVITRHTEETENNNKIKNITTQPYVDISDGEDFDNYSVYEEFDNNNNNNNNNNDQEASLRIKSAVQDAFNTFKNSKIFDIEEEQKKQKEYERKVNTNTNIQNNLDEISILKTEISNLKNIIKQFQKVPQNFITSHPGADYGLCYEVSHTYQKMLSAGVLPEYAVEILNQAQKKLSAIQLKKKAIIDAWAIKTILNLTQTSANYDSNQHKLHVFVGTSGQGKSSMLIKMASGLIVQKKKKVAILSADINKVGAVEQMKTYARILNVPFGMVREKIDWNKTLNSLKDVDYILLDTPGVNLKDINEISFMKDILPEEKTVSQLTHLVHSATDQNENAFEVGKRFKVINFDDVIFTGLDESTKFGLIYNFQRKFNIPLYAFSLGSKIPEDIEPATKERVVDLIFQITDFINPNITK